MSEIFIDVGTARLATTDVEPEREPVGTVVGLHAGVADRRAWVDGVERWSEQGWRVLTYDRRGFGESEWDAVPHSHVADLVAVMDDRGIDQAVLVGNSMGGALALDTALAHPDRVRALVLVGSAVTLDHDPLGLSQTDAEVALEDAVTAADVAGDLALVNRLECHFWLDGPNEPEGRVGGAVRDLFLEMNGRALDAPEVGEPVRPPSAWQRLSEVACPVQVVVGLLDESVTVALGRALAEQLPAAELVELPESAHLPMLDAPEAFAAEVDRFLRSLSG